MQKELMRDADLARRQNNPALVARKVMVAGQYYSSDELMVEWRNLWSWARPSLESWYPEDFIRINDDTINKIVSINLQQLKALQLKNEEQVCFLVGAGASISPNSPALSKLWGELLELVRRHEQPEIEPFLKWCEENNIQIEDFLTGLQVLEHAESTGHLLDILHYWLTSGDDKRREDNSTTLRARSVKNTSEFLFWSTIERMFHAGPKHVHKAIASFVSRHLATKIVTTNYDGCIEKSLYAAGIVCNYTLEEFIAKEERDSKVKVDLLKVHGSVNWTHCVHCQKINMFVSFSETEKPDSDTHRWKVGRNVCAKCGGKELPLIVMPLGMKYITFPSLLGLWGTAKEALTKSSIIVAIGFSFSPADSYLTDIIQGAMLGDSDTKPRALIVCNRSEEAVKHLRKRFKDGQPDFDADKHIISATGEADRVVPKVLQALKE